WYDGQFEEQEKVFDVSPFSANNFEYSNRKQTPLSSCKPDQKDIWEYEKGFSRGTKPLLPSMLLVATNPIAGQEHVAQAPTQPIPPPPPIPSPTLTSTSPPPIISSPPPPPIPTPTSPPPPPPPPETEPQTDEHIYEEQSPIHPHFSPSQAQAPSSMPTDDLLQTVP
ncbi:hypothetical protein Tco_0187737, partial [Tanacetum coccineum]